MSRSAAALALAGLVVASPATAEVVRIVDAEGVIHLTNTPCDPRYVRLAPDACPPPEVAAPTETAATPWRLDDEIARATARYGVDRRLVEAVVRVESGGDPRAVSPKGALGLMQLMPERAAALGIRDPFDPVANLDGGVRHLRNLLAGFRGNVTLALAAYNAGEEAVRAHGGVPPYPETQAYVRKVSALYGPATRSARP